MNRLLRPLRIVMSLLFIGASVMYLVLPHIAHPMSKYSERLQILPSLLGMTAGIALFWVAATLLLGRVYCSSVCPLGTLQDGVTALRRRLMPRHTFRYRRSWLGCEPAIVFFVCIAAGFGIVYAVLEPWQMFRNITSLVNPSDIYIEAFHLSVSATAGVIAGVLSLLLIVVCSLLFGREFCNSICPVGTSMRLIGRYTIMNLAIDPDACVSCMKCEEICKASCIKVSERYIDNSRCVRCFDCLDKCPEGAIHYTSSRNAAATPLMKRADKNT